MDFIQKLDKKIRDFEDYVTNFTGPEDTDKKLLTQLFVAELNVLRNEYFKDIVKP